MYSLREAGNFNYSFQKGNIMATLEIAGASKTDLHLVPPEKLVIIGLDTKDGKEHPLYDERINLPLDEGMIKNIMFQGVLENVICVRDGDRLLVAAGRQRVRNAREANKRLEKEGSTALTKVPVVIKRGTEKAAFGIMISENAIRKDDGILENAEKCRRFIEFGNTEEEAATAFGVTVQQIKNWMSFNDLSTPVRKAVEAGRISASAAVKLAPLPKDEQKTKLDELLADAPEGKKVSVSKVSKKLGKKKRKKDDDDKPTLEILTKIQEHLGELDRNKKLTGKQEGFFDALSFVLGLLSPDEVFEWYPDAAEAVKPAEPAEEVKEKKVS